ncbi:hypothetical protein CEXT_363161 [Caerostris extrusa]|uniref:Uncharacterized protein n=1 Tax=Caerostris extrusa TaxID=172846 RepID=A0AAV4R2G6_CAEEX|nr:hypothetical protein CEXT_363161 [Caerostris extrusa]
MSRHTRRWTCTAKKEDDVESDSTIRFPKSDCKGAPPLGFEPSGRRESKSLDTLTFNSLAVAAKSTSIRFPKSSELSSSIERKKKKERKKRIEKLLL